MKDDAIKSAKNFDELLDIKYGKAGSENRDKFEENAQYFIISEMLKAARKEANMTQEQLAEKIGTKKSYISRIENGKCDIQLSTLYRIFEFGLGKQVRIKFISTTIYKEFAASYPVFIACEISDTSVQSPTLMTSIPAASNSDVSKGTDLDPIANTTKSQGIITAFPSLFSQVNPSKEMLLTV